MHKTTSFISLVVSRGSFDAGLPGELIWDH